MSVQAPSAEARQLSGERVIRLQSLMPHTQHVYLDPSRFKVVICGRRWGKTWLSRAMAIVGHGPRTHGVNRLREGALSGNLIWWVTPTHGSARSTWDEFEFALRDVWIKKNATERFFDFPGGGRLHIKSGDEPNSLRGDGLKGVVIEETKDQRLKLWKEVLRPALADKLGWAVAIGTPGPPDEESLAYYLFQQAAREPRDWKRFQEPTARNPIVTPRELEAMRTELGSLVFARECEAQFVALGGSLFQRKWVKWYRPGARGLYMREGGEPVAITSLRKFATVDLAATVKTYSDYSVIGIFGLTPEGDLVVLDVIRKKFQAHEVFPAIRDAIKQWDLLGAYVEATAYNNLFVGMAASTGLPVHPLTVDKDKVLRAEPAGAMLEAGRIWLPESPPERPVPWVEEFLTELCTFPDPEAGAHDDMVDVLSSAVRVAAFMGPDAGPTPPPRGPSDGPPDPWGLRQNRPASDEWDTGAGGGDWVGDFR